MNPTARIISHEQARDFLTGQHGLRRFCGRGRRAIPGLLEKLRCIQLDPLDPIGTNADLVTLARIEGCRRGDVYDTVYPGKAFEHFAKERCLLPAGSFPWYRARATETPWWRLSERLRRLPAGILQSVLEEIRDRGPLGVPALAHRGKVEPLDWNGWKGTSNAARMAVEVLWTRCEIVVCGRAGKRKIYDIPERALGAFPSSSAGDFETWALRERVEAAGLLARAGGPAWSMLSEARTGGTAERLLEQGAIEQIVIDGSPRRYLAPRGFLKRRFPEYDDKVRILGPLDPLIWDRALIKHVFGFDYVWEVYKPAAQRRWGWYVCPLLRRGQLIGRMEATLEKNQLKVHKLWRENDLWSDDAVDEALARHARACGVENVARKKAVSAISSR